MSAPISNVRPAPDKVLTDIADYVTRYDVRSAEAFDTARYCLMDTLGCGFEALEYEACTKLLGPIVPGTVVPNGARVPGTQFQLDPVQAAFNLGAMIRWLDFNDTWLAAEWGHPSDNLGGILMAADWVSRGNVAAGRPALTVRDVLTAMIKAHEIQGCIALENSFNKVGLDHVVLVKVASTAVEAAMLVNEELLRLGKTAEDIRKITIRTHEACIRIIDKKGPLNNPADRDHCIQYMVAVPILFGRLTAEDYEDNVAIDSRIDKLRDKIVCVEDKQFTRDYLDPEKRSIANALTVELKDGRKMKEIVVEYPIGHKRRRKDAIPNLVEKFRTNLARRFPEKQPAIILALCLNPKQ